MTKLSCKISDLEEICRLISLKGKNPQGKEFVAIPDFLLVCAGPTGSIPGSEGYADVKAVDNKGAIAVSLRYKNIKVVQDGVIPIGDVESFQKYLARFNSSDEVTVETTENKIIITRQSPSKIARIPMASVDSLTTSKNAEAILSNFKKNEAGYFQSKKTNLNLRLTLNAGDIKNVVDDGEAVGQRIYPWKLEANQLFVKVGEEQLGEIETQITTLKTESFTKSGDAPETQTAFAYGIDNIFGNLSGEVKIYLANGVQACPLILTQSTDKYSLKILLAPVTVTE